MTEEERTSAVADFASRHGLSFSEDSSADLLRSEFFLFSLSRDEVIAVARNVVEGLWNGVAVEEFDCTSAGGEVLPGPGGSLYRVYPAGFSVAQAELSASLPYVGVRKKDWLTRLADDIDRIDHLHHNRLETVFGYEPFDDGFEVLGRDHQFTRLLFDPSLMDQLLSSGPDIAYEISRDRLIAYLPQLPVDELPEIMDAASRFVLCIPDAVWERYGTRVEAT